MARQLHPEALYRPLFLLMKRRPKRAAPAGNGLERQAGAMLAAVPGRRRRRRRPVSPALGLALKQLARSGAAIGALSAGIYPLAQLGLLDGYRAAVALAR